MLMVMNISLRERWLVFALCLLGTFLRFYTLGAKSIWLDEAFTLWVARHSLADVWRWIVTIDQHPPLYYLLLSLWIRWFGDSEAALRSLPALLSTLTLPLFYFTVRKVTDSITALLALFLLAISPFHVHYAQENRMYSLLALAGCGAIYFVLAIAKQASTNFSFSPRVERASWRWANWHVIGLALCQAIGMWTHNTFVVFFPLALGIGLALARLETREGRIFGKSSSSSSPIGRLLPPLLTAQLLALSLWLPWLGNFVRQSLKVDQDFWIGATGTAQILDALRRLLADHVPVESVVTLWLLLALLLGLVGWRRFVQMQKVTGSLLFSFALLPFAAEVLIGLRRPLLHPPSLIWTTLPLYLLVALGINWVAQPGNTLRRWLLIVGVSLAAAVNGIGLIDYYQFVEKEQWADVAQFVNQYASANDLILFNATWVQLPFEYYAQRDGLNAELRGMPGDLFDREVSEPKMRAADLPYLRQLITGRRRVWLIYSHDWYTDPQQITLNELRTQLHEEQFKAFESVRVFEFVSSDAR